MAQRETPRIMHLIWYFVPHATNTMGTVAVRTGYTGVWNVI